MWWRLIIKKKLLLNPARMNLTQTTGCTKEAKNRNRIHCMIPFLRSPTTGTLTYVTDVAGAATSVRGRQEVSDQGGVRGSFWGVGSILCLDLGVGYMRGHTEQNA